MPTSILEQIESGDYQTLYHIYNNEHKNTTESMSKIDRRDDDDKSRDIFHNLLADNLTSNFDKVFAAVNLLKDYEKYYNIICAMGSTIDDPNLATKLAPIQNILLTKIGEALSKQLNDYEMNVKAQIAIIGQKANEHLHSSNMDKGQTALGLSASLSGKLADLKTKLTSIQGDDKYFTHEKSLVKLDALKQFQKSSVKLIENAKPILNKSDWSSILKNTLAIITAAGGVGLLALAYNKHKTGSYFFKSENEKMIKQTEHVIHHTTKRRQP
jgi:hypothetical protein